MIDDRPPLDHDKLDLGSAGRITCRLEQSSARCGADLGTHVGAGGRSADHNRQVGVTAVAA